MRQPLVVTLNRNADVMDSKQPYVCPFSHSCPTLPGVTAHTLPRLPFHTVALTLLSYKYSGPFHILAPNALFGRITMLLDAGVVRMISFVEGLYFPYDGEEKNGILR